MINEKAAFEKLITIGCLIPEHIQQITQEDDAGTYLHPETRFAYAFWEAGQNQALQHNKNAIHWLRMLNDFVACDASAISYVSLGEYRTALLKMLRQALAEKEPGI